MSVFEGDEWKYAKCPKDGGQTRAEKQRQLDDDYAHGTIDLEEWRSETGILSWQDSTRTRVLRAGLVTP